MELKELLQNIPNAKERAFYISFIGDSQERFDELLEYALHEKDPVRWRAAWILDGCDEQWPDLSSRHISTMVTHLPHLHSEGTLRSLLRLLSRHGIPEEEQGLLVELCFQYLTSELYPVAVKVYAMEIIYNHCRIYPELARELITIIQDQYENHSAGFKARGTMILNRLKKEGHEI